MNDPITVEQNALLNVHEVAEIFRVSYMTIYRLVRDGELRSIRVGRSYRIPRSAVDEFVVTHATAA